VAQLKSNRYALNARSPIDERGSFLTEVTFEFPNALDAHSKFPAASASGRVLGSASSGFLRALRSAASFARRHVRRAVELLASESIVARRYVGALGGSAGRESLVLFFVGRERFAREFELYFREGGYAGRGIAPAAILFRGNLVQYLLHRARLAQEAREADFVAHEVFPGALADADGHLHYPMLQGSLRVEGSIDRQICRMRSRAQRRRARALLRQGGYREWLEHGPEALEKFRATLYEPYVRARFGAWSFVNGPAELHRLHARKGCILFVARSDRPSEPVCGALLLDEGPGVVAYFLNGFSDAGRGDPARIAEHTMALELAVMKHAIERKLLRIELGYTRAILSDGLFTHKRRLGGDFIPQAGSPLFRVRVRPTRRAAIFARFPLLVVGPHGWTALLGFDDAAPRLLMKREWRGMFKSYRRLGLWQATVWTNASGERARDPLGEPAFRSALAESLDLPGRIDFLIDGEPSESKR
jgi:hypothetical protein